MNSSDKKQLPVFILAIKISDPKAKDIDIAMIGIDAYCAAYYLKKAQVFALSMRDIQYQAEKDARAENNPKSVIPYKYHDFLDIFPKKDLDTLSSHQKYDHKIYLEEEQKPGFAPVYKIIPKKLDVMKRYLDFHLAKRFIQVSLISNSLFVLFVKKPGGGIWFYVDYKRLNTITKKDCYLIPLIEKILAQFKNAKYFTKIDIYQAYYQIKMFKNSEKLTTFLVRFGAFQYLIILFGLYNWLTSW